MHINLLFDLDQTLLDFHASERKALELTALNYGLKYSDRSYQLFKECNKSLWLELEKGTISRAELFRKRFAYFFEISGAAEPYPDLVKVNDEFIYIMSQHGVLMDGALDFVKKVRREIRDSRIYIASNGATVNAEGRIRSTGLGEYIEKLFISERMGAAKPSAEFFDICLEDIAEPRETCIMIGDSLTSDMLGAKNAGLRSVWFMPTGDIEASKREYEIDHCASSFDELLVILKDWAETIRE